MNQKDNLLRVLKPSWNLFDRLVTEAKRELIICAPWISSAGLRRLQQHMMHTAPGRPLPRVQILARVADINTDGPGILEFVKRMNEVGVHTEIRDSPLLHAKVYLADRTLALVTSANLSEGGFSGNLEAAVVVSDEEGIGQVVRLLAGIQAETDLVSASDLEFFVKTQLPSLSAQSTQQAPPAIVPVWRRSAGPEAKKPVQSRAVNLLDIIKTVEASLQAAQGEIQHIDLSNWVDKKARVWACPCYVTRGISPYLAQLATPFSFGELELDQRLIPERFTMMEGTVERIIEHSRALFRKKRSRVARIELTRYPDRGAGSILQPTGREPHFLLKIQAA
jgi:hypothetical protein